MARSRLVTYFRKYLEEKTLAAKVPLSTAIDVAEYEPLNLSVTIFEPQLVDWKEDKWNGVVKNIYLSIQGVKFKCQEKSTNWFKTAAAKLARDADLE